MTAGYIRLDSYQKKNCNKFEQADIVICLAVVTEIGSISKWINSFGTYYCHSYINQIIVVNVIQFKVQFKFGHILWKKKLFWVSV